jgi:hypothetical protein
MLRFNITNLYLLWVIALQFWVQQASAFSVPSSDPDDDVEVFSSHEIIPSITNLPDEVRKEEMHIFHSSKISLQSFVDQSGIETKN